MAGQPAPVCYQKTLGIITSSCDIFVRSALQSFSQFNSHPGFLTQDEIYNLLADLMQNLGVCPPEMSVSFIEKRTQDFLSDDGTMDFESFLIFFWKFLNGLSSPLFPFVELAVKRCEFVRRINLRQIDIFSVFEFLEALGEGSFGKVYLVREKVNSVQRCCKLIIKDQLTIPLGQIEAEVMVLKNLDHPNISKIMDVYENEKMVFLVLDLCRGGDLSQLLESVKEKGKVLSEKYVFAIFVQIFSALTYMHSRNVVHRDLKLQNIMLQHQRVWEPAVRIIDFGLAHFKSGEETSQKSGTALYMSPEVFELRTFSRKCDIWSAGVVLFYLLTGRSPFTGKTWQDLKRQVLTADPPWSLCHGLSKDVLDLMKAMLNKDSEKRPDAKECLEHPWIAKHSLKNPTPIISPELKANVKRFSKLNPLKRGIWNLVAHHLPEDSSDILQLAHVFKAVNQTKSGSISKEEFLNALEHDGHSPEASNLFSALDCDREGSLSWTNFLAGTYSWKQKDICLIESVFLRFDKNSDSVVTLNEISVGLCWTAKMASKAERFFAKIEKADPQCITLQEFKDYMKK